jgi:hypothetical protein
MMQKNRTTPPESVVVCIADSGFVLPVYILVLSLKHFQPAQRIHILGISLSADEKALFEQFEHVFVFDSAIPRSDKPGAMRIIADILKGEALLTAEECTEAWIALLDGDCIATGDITPYLEPGRPGLYVRERSPAEDNKIFLFYRKSGEAGQGIPQSFLDQWQRDVGERSEPVRTATVLSGNLVLHRDYLEFSKVWKTFMERVLSPGDPDSNNAAYYMPAEFALSALLTFAQETPPVYDVLLGSDPQAHVAHLGPSPKYWHIWNRKNLKHFDRIAALLDEAKSQGYTIPLLPFALKKRNKPAITALACVYDLAETAWKRSKRLYKRFFRNSFQSQARRYGRKTW